MVDKSWTHVFVSYSHEDRPWLERLKIHLRPLGRDHQVETWEDTRISPGSKWREEIAKAIESADVAILLVSADFLASDFIVTNELPPLLKGAEVDGTLVLPIIVSPSLFGYSSNLVQFQAINDPANPLISLPRGEQEMIFVQVAEVVYRHKRLAVYL